LFLPVPGRRLLETAFAVARGYFYAGQLQKVGGVFTHNTQVSARPGFSSDAASRFSK